MANTSELGKPDRRCQNRKKTLLGAFLPLMTEHVDKGQSLVTGAEPSANSSLKLTLQTNATLVGNTGRIFPILYLQ